MELHTHTLNGLRPLSVGVCDGTLVRWLVTLTLCRQSQSMLSHSVWQVLRRAAARGAALAAQ